MSSPAFDAHNSTAHGLWIRRAKRLQRQLNGGLVWDLLWSRLLTLTAVLTLTLFLLRLVGWALWPVIPVAFMALALLFFSLRPTLRSRWFSTRDTLAIIDLRLRLDCRLTAAADGIAPWPDPATIPWPEKFYRWEPRQTVGPGALILILWGMAFLLPTPGTSRAEPYESSPPPAWDEVQTWLESLAGEEAFDPEALASLEETLDRLMAQDAADWFRHESLEAGEMLRERTREAMAEMADLLRETTRFLELARQADALTPEQAARFQEQWLEHLDDLAASRLPLTQDLLDQLASLDVQQLPQLSPEMLEELRERMECAGGACTAALGENGANGEAFGGPDGEDLAALLAWLEARGGIGQGPGPSPLTLAGELSPELPGTTEHLHNPSTDQATRGDYLGAATTDIPDEMITPWTGPAASGGTIASPGGEGDITWSQTLTPSEQEFLQRYFD